MKTKTFLLGLLIGIFGKASADTLPVNVWLISPTLEIQKPAFAEVKNLQSEVFKDVDLLKIDQHNLKDVFPAPNSPWFNQNTQWNEVHPVGGKVEIDNPNPENNSLKYACTYLWVEKWTTLKLELKSNQMFRIWLDDNELGVKTSIEAKTDKPGKFTKELKLERGKHKLIVKTIQFPNDSVKWTMSSALIADSLSNGGIVSFENNPTNRKHISHIMHGTRTTGVRLSHDAKYYTISFRTTKPGGENSESWTEIRQSLNDKIVYTFQHAKISQIQWLPMSNRLSFVANSGKDRIVTLLNVETLLTEPLFSESEDFAGYTWSPNEMYLIYSINEPDNSTYTTTRQIQGMRDRQAGFRNRSFLYRYNIKTSDKTRLTFGNQSTYIYDISPDNKTIAIGTSIPDYTERPFSKQQMYLLDVETMRIDTLWNDKRWGVNVSFSPSGKQLLCSGGPSAFGSIGENLAKGKIANNYDNQLYIYDLAGKTIEPITLRFDPSVDDAHWSRIDNCIYVNTTDKDTKRVYKYDVVKKVFTPLSAQHEYTTAFSLATNSLTAVMNKSQVTSPGNFLLLDLKSGKTRIIENKESENYKNVEFGDYKEWDFVTSAGVTLKGRFYLPVKFNPEKKYPVIVYYYGGTSPVGRTFGGRYPFNLWAGAGYVVYVLQPSGATGFGQEFSSAHVNNWGITVADEIIEGTRHFLAEHPFADEHRVGCIGASYGGFMTMLLTTRTDIFAAAISHAGISSISSYWGEGYWGYAYSAEASAESYPWNSKELYVNQSPLFNADKINTPLLLLTGDSDTNVPPGESIQLYTALKILGKPVELITVKDEDHHIVGYKNRIAWHNTIMAWWDKYLKGQNEWWNDLYPTKNY